jgi:Cu/Ag efflux pump CusA
VEHALQGIQFPLEYHAEVIGASAQQQAALPRLLGATVAAVIWIFLLLQAAYGSWRLAFIAIVTLPMVLAGGVLAALLGGGVLAFGSLFGLLTVLGIAVRNGILMTTHLQHLEQQEGEPFGPELVLRGARERLAPILMTAFATGMALLPFVPLGDIAGTEIVRPMAIVILGGLVTSTLLDLFILPALYLRFGTSPVPVTSSPQVPEPSLDLA